MPKSFTLPLVFSSTDFHSKVSLICSYVCCSLCSSSINVNLLLLSLITFTTTTFAAPVESHQYLPRDLPPARPAACIDCQDQLWTWISLSSTGSQGTYTCNHPWTGCTMTGAPGGNLCDTPIGLISQNYDTHDNINPTYKSGRGGVHTPSTAKAKNISKRPVKSTSRISSSTTRKGSQSEKSPKSQRQTITRPSSSVALYLTS